MWVEEVARPDVFIQYQRLELLKVLEKTPFACTLLDQKRGAKPVKLPLGFYRHINTHSEADETKPVADPAAKATRTTPREQLPHPRVSVCSSQTCSTPSAVSPQSCCSSATGQAGGSELSSCHPQQLRGSSGSPSCHKAFLRQRFWSACSDTSVAIQWFAKCRGPDMPQAVPPAAKAERPPSCAASQPTWLPIKSY